jgi:hypothetical protein
MLLQDSQLVNVGVMYIPEQKKDQEIMQSILTDRTQDKCKRRWIQASSFKKNDDTNMIQIN